MKRIISLIVVISLFFSLTGCEALRKKFTRKKKEEVKAPRFYQVKKYEKKPTPELYKKHYAYWMSWQSEIISVLGENHKKDIRCIEEIIGNLKDMQNMLVKEKAERMQQHIDALAKIRDTIVKEEIAPINRDYIKRRLEREERFIRSEFEYKKVRDYLKKSFDE